MREWFADARVRIAALTSGAVAAIALGLGVLTRNWLVALLIALTLLLAVLVGLLVRLLLRREREDALQVGVGDARRASALGAGAAATGALSAEERFAAELDEIRAKLGRARGGPPWWLVLGEAGAGKSALVAGSGLEFPAQVARRNFESTRFGSAILADQAVVIDTSGRFARGGEEWRRLLGLLREARPGCPVDGVIVVVPAASLLRPRGGDLDEEARELRRRLNEIRVELAVDPPVYVVVSKADQLEGFAETVQALPKSWREQAVGWTNDQRRLADPEARVAEAFESLAARLDGFVAELLLREPDPARQRRIFVFPEQIGGLAHAAARFAGVAFRRDAYSDAAPFLRGVYLTSARGGEPAEPAFARDLFLEIARGDEGLALPQSRLGPLGRRAVWLAAGVAVAWLLAVWGVSFAQNYSGTHDLARRAERALSADPSLRDLTDLWTALADARRDAHSLISWLGFDTLGKAVERGERVYTFAFERSFDRLTKRNLENALAGRDERAVRASIALATDLDWLASRGSDLDQLPDLSDYLPQSAAQDANGYNAAYAAYTRLLGDRERDETLRAEQTMLAGAAGRLLHLTVLEEITSAPTGGFPAVRFEQFGLASPGDPLAYGVAGIYTAKGNDKLIGRLLGAIERTDSVSPGEVNGFRRQYAERYIASWRRFLQGAPIAAKAEPDPKSSPYLKLLPAIDANMSVDLPGDEEHPAWAQMVHDVLSTSAGVGAFLPGGDPAAKELGPPWTAYQKALDAVALDVESASTNGERALGLARDVAEGKPNAFASALDVVGKITRQSGDPAASQKLRELLSAPVLDGFSAVLLAARAELERRWSERIASRFAGELSAQRLAELYTPSTGELPKFVAEELAPFYKDGVPRPVLGDRSLPLGPGFLAWMGRAREMSAHLSGGAIPGGVQAVRLRGVPSTVEGSDGLRVARRDLRLVCPDGEQVFLYREGSGEQTFNWRSSCEEVALRVVLVSVANPSEVEVAREWRGPLALPQFLQEGRVPGSDVYEWSVEGPEGSKVHVRYRLVSGADVGAIAHQTPPASLGS